MAGEAPLLATYVESRSRRVPFEPPDDLVLHRNRALAGLDGKAGDRRAITQHLPYRTGLDSIAAIGAHRVVLLPLPEHCHPVRHGCSLWFLISQGGNHCVSRR